MKFFQNVFTKRERWDTDKPIVTEPGRRKGLGFWSGKKYTADSTSTMEESTSCCTEVSASWRVENILVHGSPTESDWWEEADSVEREYGGDRCHQSIGRALASKSGGDEAVSSQMFRNVGLETWKQVQEAWRMPQVEYPTLPPYPTKEFRRELKHGLRANRDFDMRQNVALEDLVEIFNEMWTEDTTS